MLHHFHAYVCQTIKESDYTAFDNSFWRWLCAVFHFIISDSEFFSPFEKIHIIPHNDPVCKGSFSSSKETSRLEKIDKWSKSLRKKVEPKRLHPWRRFMVRNSAPPLALFWCHLQTWLLRGKTAPPSKVAPFSKTVPGWSRFGSTFFLIDNFFYHTAKKLSPQSKNPWLLDTSWIFYCLVLQKLRILAR